MSSCRWGVLTHRTTQASLRQRNTHRCRCPHITLVPWLQRISVDYLSQHNKQVCSPSFVAAASCGTSSGETRTSIKIVACGGKKIVMWCLETVRHDTWHILPVLQGSILLFKDVHAGMSASSFATERASPRQRTPRHFFSSTSRSVRYEFPDRNIIESVYVYVTIFALCGHVGVLDCVDATRFLSATGVGLLFSVASSTFVSRL